MIECDKIVTVLDIVSTKKTNAVTINVTSTASINCHSIKVRYCYALQTVLSVIISVLIITIIYYHYSKQNNSNAQTI